MELGSNEALAPFIFPLFTYGGQHAIESLPYGVLFW